MPDALINATKLHRARRISDDVYPERIAQRTQYRFRPKSRRDADGHVVMRCPAAEPVHPRPAAAANTGHRIRIPRGTAGVVRHLRRAVQIHYRDPVVTAAGELAFVHTLTSMTATPAGAPQSFTFWFRSTFGLRRAHGHWLIAHRHESTPFHMDGSFRAATDLQP